MGDNMIHTIKHWRIFLMIGAALLIAAGLIGYGFFMGEQLYSVESPLLSAVGEIEFEASRIRTWVENALAGVQKYEDDRYFDHLEQSIHYLESLVGSKKFPAINLTDSEKIVIFLKIDKLHSILGTCKHVLLKFNSHQPRHSQSADLQTDVASTFSDFSTTLFEIKTAIVATIEESKFRFRLVQGVLIVLGILLIVAATTTKLRHDSEKLRHVEQLESGRRELQNELAVRKAAEKTLADNEQLLRTVFDYSPVAIVVTRLADSRIVDVNNVFVASSGYERTEVLGRTFQDIPVWGNPADREAVLQRLTIDRQVRDMEFQFRTKDGRARTFLLSANIVNINDEAHILAFGLDVTDLKLFEKALRESEERLKAVVDNLPVGVWFTDERGQIVYGNPAGRKIWQGARYVSPDKFHEYRARWADTGIAVGADDWAVTRAIRDGEASLNEVLDIECFDGTRKIILNSAVPMRDPTGQIIGVVALNEDITERKNAEAHMMWLASFPMLNPYPIVEVGLEGHVHHLNPAAEKLFPDISKQSAGHAWLSDWESVTRTFCNDGTKTAVRELLCDGKWYHQAMHWVEETRRIRIYGLDITARKQAEEALKLSHDALETWVNERTQQLLESNQRLKSEVEERLRTEQSLMKHQVQLRKLSSALVQTEERERRRISTAIHDGIGQTLAATKIKLGAMRSTLPPGELAGQLDETRNLISSAIQETRSLTFELSLPVLYEIGLQAALEWMAEQFQRKFGLRIIVTGDGSDRWLDITYRVFLFQAIRELCFNVVKHARATRVTVSIQGDAELIRCDVADDGIGFDAKKHHQDGTADMGFGLFSIREQLREYGGVLTLQTNPGGGTIVALKLPPKTDSTLRGGTVYDDPGVVGG
jgi:PAS domain S-box-containing protein